MSEIALSNESNEMSKRALYGWRRAVLDSLSAVALASALSASAPAWAQSVGANGANSKTIGLVLTDWRYALVETEDMSECPDGLQVGEIEQFKALPDPIAKSKECANFQTRGPNCEIAIYAPTVVEDAYPWRELQTDLGYGVNLDGAPDGQATENTCAHEKFTSPDGRKVDNQMARVVGCIMGWRTTGFMAEFYSDEIETDPVNRHLIEVAGVDSEENDDSVEVFLYKGLDRLVRDASGAHIPFISHRIDDNHPEFMYETTGRIVDGVLVTDPIPYARLPLSQIQTPGERHLRDMRLRLTLNENGAEGFLGGYEVIDTWWNMYGKGPGITGAAIGRFSGAGLYDAVHRHADGYPDPETGQCTAISAGYKVDAVRVLIVHPEDNRVQTGYEREARAR